MEQRKMNRKVSIKSAIVAIVLACIITASVVASVLYQRLMTNTMRIVGGNFKLIRSDDLEVDVTSINNPQILIGFASLSMSAAIISLV